MNTCSSMDWGFISIGIGFAVFVVCVGVAMVIDFSKSP